MIGLFALNHIISETQKDKLEIIDFLHEYDVFCENHGCKLCVSYMGRNILNGHSNYLGNKIQISSAWVIRVMKNLNDTNSMNAFRLTIGHELGHKKKEFFALKHLIHLKTMRHVVEVHCDFYAAKSMENSRRENLLNSIHYKMKESSNSSKSYLTHPSWIKRLEYSEKFNFNDELIEKIAKDTGCANSKMVNEMIEFYRDRFIYLQDS